MEPTPILPQIARGERFRGKVVLDLVQLSNGWCLLKTENSKSPRDFRVKVIYQLFPRPKSITPKHAHFAIDFYGKFCADKERAMGIFRAIIGMWQGSPVKDLLIETQEIGQSLPGYSPEYILYALRWILEQEDINFAGRPAKKQLELDEVLKSLGIKTPSGREGSQLAISLLCNIALGLHPVEAMKKASLDVLPVKRSKGAV